MEVSKVFFDGCEVLDRFWPKSIVDGMKFEAAFVEKTHHESAVKVRNEDVFPINVKTVGEHRIPIKGLTLYVSASNTLNDVKWMIHDKEERILPRNMWMMWEASEGKDLDNGEQTMADYGISGSTLILLPRVLGEIQQLRY